MGGRITASSDAGFIYNTYGFGYIHELELLQEAGFHPLEVIQTATMNPALTLHEPKGKPIEFGVVREGLLADLVIVDQNPLENLKVLYGTGAVKLNDKTGKAERVGAGAPPLAALARWRSPWASCPRHRRHGCRPPAPALAGPERLDACVDAAAQAPGAASTAATTAKPPAWVRAATKGVSARLPATVAARG